MTTTADLLREYGSSLRGNWGEIDGRSEKRSLDDLAELIDEHGNVELPEPKVVSMRSFLGVCPLGKGHWIMYCDDYDTDED